MAINWRGEVMLCCTAYDERRYKLGSYLDTPLEELQALKYRDTVCESCMSNGIHQLFTYETRGLDALAFANVARHHPDVSLEATQVPKRGLLRRSWKAARRTGRRLARRLR
jgi:hypothetical protein